MAQGREERTAVKTYVPRYQKEEWNAHAEELDMSLSEFVRSMVQAGRRGFEGLDDDGSERGTNGEPEESAPSDASPGGEDVRTVVLEVLDDGPRSAEDLVDAVVGDLREDVFDAIEALQDEGRVTHDPRSGGYRVVDGE